MIKDEHSFYISQIFWADLLERMYIEYEYLKYLKLQRIIIDWDWWSNLKKDI
jgi:hypothetical protein